MPKYKTIALIHNDEDNRLQFMEAVRVARPASESIYFDSADSSYKFLTDAAKPFPDIIFLDLDMPGRNGKEFLQKIRSLSYLNHIPVIIFPTSDVYKDKTDLLKLGSNGFLTKVRNLNSRCEKLGILI